MSHVAPIALPFTQESAAQELLASNHLALLTGLVLYQQIAVEKAFVGPYLLQQRLGEPLTADAVLSRPEEAIVDFFQQKPAIHRFPANMAKRVFKSCGYVLSELENHIPALWNQADDANEVLRAMKKLPGFGDYKARVYFGVLAKWYAIRPPGWEELVPDWPSIADIESLQDLEGLKARKKAWKIAQAG